MPKFKLLSKLSKLEDAPEWARSLYIKQGEEFIQNPDLELPEPQSPAPSDKGDEDEGDEPAPAPQKKKGKKSSTSDPDELEAVRQAAEKAQREIAEYKAEVARQKLHAKLTEVLTSKGIRANAIEDAREILAKRFSFDENGQIVGKDEAGKILVNTAGQRVTPEEYINTTLRSQKDYLFAQSTGSGANNNPTGNVQKNPFVKGKDYDRDQIYHLLRTNPAQAKALQQAAKAINEAAGGQS